jgi:hypothetical protein
MLNAFNLQALLDPTRVRKPQKVSKLASSVYEILKERIEAEYAYNKTLLELYEEYPELEHKINFSQFGITSNLPEFTPLIKQDVLKDKLFYEKYLKRLESDRDQGRVLDDIYEEMRYALYTHCSIVSKLTISEFVKKQATEPLALFCKAIEPHCSDFQKQFMKFNTMQFNPQTKKANYVADLSGYRKHIDKELDALEKLYKSKNDNLGLSNIADKKRVLSDPVATTMAVVEGLSLEEAADPIISNREAFYLYYNLLEEAKRFSEERKIQWEKESGEASNSPSPKVALNPLPTPLVVPKIPEVPNKPAEVKVVKDKIKPPAAEDIKTIKNTVKANIVESDNSSVADSLKKKKFKNALTELFYTDPKKAKIEETVLQGILKRVGGEIGENSKSVRRQLSFKAKIGFIPKPDPNTEKAHYHTTNTRYVNSGVIRHYRDFFHRIGIAPYQLWPEEFKKLEYRPTKTTRVFTKK